jgi:cysteinyl-tRNA synthetase
MTSLQLYNTRTRRLEAFVPQNPARVTMYCCGPTVYSFAHIGNARPPVLFGLLARVLKLLYPGALYARNITDVDDKINQAAIEQNLPISAITERFTAAYLADTGAVGADLPDLQPKATAHIPHIVTMCETLIARGHAYCAADHVLFDVSSYADYGSLSRRSLKEMIAGARVDVAPYKKNAADFVLWKPSTPELPGWDSPWGRGRPGWHIECSAMAKAHLGETIDIHAGGNDLLFPHHENEVAQSTCAHGGKVFANYWLHNGMLTVDGAKMSKSLGNIHLISALTQKYAAEALRYWLLSGHYRQPLDFSDAAMVQAKTTLDRLYGTLRDLADIDCELVGERAASAATLAPGVFAALCDDLNTPTALAELNALAKAAQKALGVPAQAQAKRCLLAAGALLGLLQATPQAWFQGDAGATAAQSSEQSTAHFDALLLERDAARAAKNYARSDAIRAEFAAAGIVVEDTARGARWKRA